MLITETINWTSLYGSSKIDFVKLISHYRRKTVPSCDTKYFLILNLFHHPTPLNHNKKCSQASFSCVSYKRCVYKHRKKGYGQKIFMLKYPLKWKFNTEVNKCSIRDAPYKSRDPFWKKKTKIQADAGKIFLLAGLNTFKVFPVRFYTLCDALCPMAAIQQLFESI